MTCDEERAFWQVIRENPKDDMPRLIFTDWLNKHENRQHDYAAHARFICAQ